MLLLKLDISKAFDTLSWPFLLELLRARGFGERWYSWIATLLSTTFEDHFEWAPRTTNQASERHATGGLPIPDAIYHSHGHPSLAICQG
jgi:hypothetical protein